MRVFELAREAGVSSADVVKAAEMAGIEAAMKAAGRTVG